MLLTDPISFVENLEEQNIYLFASPQISSELPHYFICIKRCDGGLLYMSCCTSQYEKKVRFIESRSLPFETLVYIRPTNEVPFNKETYINCNDVLLFSIEDLKNEVTNGELHFKGKISDNHYQQILKGIHASPLVEEEIKMLIPTP
jgi:hypothetical protein